ncbi:MAG: class II fructose-bisphosphate aldolase [Candidatus Nealsonbacteria bacterium]|nr:class II fructose-bisphosphate aldolase [Candidatus Nealsonbacteria bacterium]
MKSLKRYFDRALKEKWAIPQFNISNLETLKAIAEAAKSLRSPVIIGTSEGESGFLGLDRAVVLVDSFRKESGLSLFLNLDHCHSLDYCKRAIDKGYNTCHFDGSKLLFDDNIKITKKLVKYAHKKNILVEGEIDEIGSANLTDPNKAAFFCKKTGVDRLALNIGTFHGKKGKVNISHLKKIKEKVGNLPLVLHGASGVKDEDIKEAIKLGITKININTELRMAFTNALKEVLGKNPDEVVPYKYMPKAIEAVRRSAEEKIRLFGSQNKA